MRNNKAKSNKPKKPATKSKLKKVEADTNSIQNVNYVPPVYNSDTYTNQANSTTTYTSVSGDELPKTYTTIESNSLYAKIDEPVEEASTKRSELLPSNPYNNGNMIIMGVGVLAFFALLILLLQ